MINVVSLDFYLFIYFLVFSCNKVQSASSIENFVQKDNEKLVCDDVSVLKNPDANVAPATGREEDSRYSDVIKCNWTRYPKQIFSDVLFGMLNKNRFKIVPEVEAPNCTMPAECRVLCENLGCNYFVISKESKDVMFYHIKESVFQEGKVEASKIFDSFIVTCKPIDSVDSDCPDGDINVLFQRFIKKYRRSYALAEIPRRMAIFKDNVAKIIRLNRLRTAPYDATFSVNEYTDWDSREFHNSFAGSPTVRVIKEDVTNFQAQLHAWEKCPKWDWRSMGVVPSVKSQNNCASSYAFASVDLVATQYNIDRKKINQSLSMSSQFVIDCFNDTELKGCHGGRASKVLTKMISTPVPSEFCYPSINLFNETGCRKPICPGNYSFNVEWVTSLDCRGFSEKRLMSAVLHYGPAVVTVDAGAAWQFYNGTGIINAHSCSTITNHAVLLVGYDFSGPVPYYIVKNSWSTKWGDKGYVRIQANKNTCGIAQDVTIVCTKNCKKFQASRDALCTMNSVGCGLSGDDQACAKT